MNVHCGLFTVILASWRLLFGGGGDGGGGGGERLWVCG